MTDCRMLIGGAWVDSDQEFMSTNPATGESLGSVAQATEQDVAHAVRAAAAALQGWRAMGPESRAEILKRVVARLRKEYGDAGEPTPLKNLITTEMGKRLPEADVEVAESADMVEFFAVEGPTLLAPRHLALDRNLWPTKRSSVVFDPVGVVAVIKPWNYPLELPIWAIAPALVAGNTVVFKPSEHAPMVGTELARLFMEEGLPPGVINVLHGDGAVGRMLVESPDVDMVSFTGSATAGRVVATHCASRLCRYSLELGGNDPAIVLRDVDLELAANGLVWGCFANSGQVCVRPKRVFVQRGIEDALIAAVIERTRALRVDVDYGPIVSRPQLDHVDEQIQATIKQGASLLAGGEKLERPGNYYSPTVLSQLTPGMRVMQEECFGPLMPIMVFDTKDQAVALANDTRFGLGASVWTADQALGAELARDLRAGMVWINDVNVAFPQAPWGGIKDSGPGVDLGEFGLHEYTVKKHIDLETGDSSRRDWWYPY